ncbi:hypothetical protein ACPC54_26960 [Kitasatospora sp. NPDC094028]
MGWRAVTWSAVAVGALAAVALGVYALLAGADRASGLAGVIVGFCEIGALVLGVVGWAAERRAAPAATAPTAQTTPAPAQPQAQNGKFAISAERIEKAQFGDGNTQHNA